MVTMETAQGQNPEMERETKMSNETLSHDSDPITATKYTRTDNETTRTEDAVDGHTHNVDYQRDEEETLKGQFDDRKAKLTDFVNARIAEAQEKRQQLEDIRANHRNFNRMLTLFGAIVIGVVVTYGLEHSWVPDGKTLGPYSFVITVTLDMLLALYALIRHY